MKKSDDKCTIMVTISAVTKQRGKKDKHGQFERRLENVLQDFYVAYMKHLVTKIPGTDIYTWKQVNKHTIELVGPEAA